MVGQDRLAAVRLYAAGIKRVIPRGGWDVRKRIAPRTDALVFVVGSPRSGTTFLAGALAALPGFVDLGEMTPLKAALPELSKLPEREQAEAIHRIIERVRTLGLVTGLRGIEQTPETAYCLSAALAAFPQGKAVHIIRDGRDVVCSLLERGWLNAGRAGGADDAKLPYGARARFWVDPADVEAFETASDATRAAWAWRSYVTAARAARPSAREIRYEQMTADPAATAKTIAEHLGVASEPLVESLSRAHDTSIGRFRTELTTEQLADVETQAGPLLAELGYQ